MSDDLVKRLRTPWDTDRSIISQTDKWMKDRKEAADRIEELEAKLERAAKEVSRWMNCQDIEYAIRALASDPKAVAEIIAAAAKGNNT